MITEKLETILKDSHLSRADACVIWLHGLGASGDDFAEVMPDLKLPSDLAIRFIFPHAPQRLVTLAGGLSMPAWYDILGLTAQTPEDSEGIELACHQLSKLIEEQHQEGIAYNRIFLIGFSQGGALSLYTGLKFPHRLGGVAALSSYLPLQPRVKKSCLEKADYTLPIFMAHGERDNVVSFDLGDKSRQVLEAIGFQVEWHTYPILHNVSLEELRDIGQWLVNHLS